MRCGGHQIVRDVIALLFKFYLYVCRLHYTYYNNILLKDQLEFSPTNPATLVLPKKVKFLTLTMK